MSVFKQKRLGTKKKSAKLETESQKLLRDDLITKAKAGDAIAFEAYHKLNLGLMMSLVNRYKTYMDPTELEDLKQEGLMGLMRGIKAYDKSKMKKDSKPETYIYFWVRAAIDGYVDKICNTPKKNQVSNSISPLNEEENIYESLPGDSEPTDTKTNNREFDEWTAGLVKNMPERERTIILERTLSDEPETLLDLGDKFGVSRERIRQIENELKQKVKTAARDVYDLNR